MKVICWEGKVMISGGIMRDGVCESSVYPCGICALRVEVNSVLIALACIEERGWSSLENGIGLAGGWTKEQ